MYNIILQLHLVVQENKLGNLQGTAKRTKLIIRYYKLYEINQFRKN